MWVIQERETEDDCRVLARGDGRVEFITVRKTGRGADLVWKDQ